VFGKGPTIYLVPAGARAPRKAAVVVALDRPGVLGRTKARVRLATYGDTEASIRALVDVLVGTARAPGRLPVRVPGVSRRGC
jgi:beta-N-acetylhexosaminidase